MQPPQEQPPVQPGLPMNSASPPVILYTQPQSSVNCNVNILSIMQIILGSLAVIFGIWDIAKSLDICWIFAGIWAGLLFIIAGSLGVRSSNIRTTSAIKSFLVMSIIASVSAIFLVISTSFKLYESTDRRDEYVQEYKRNRYHYHRGDNLVKWIQKLEMVIAISAILLLISLIEAVMAIISSFYTCRGLSCSESQQENVPIQCQVQYIPGPDGQNQMVFIPMPNQANPMTANSPYQITTPIGGFKTHPPTTTQGGIPTGMPQLHQAQAAAQPQPPTYPEKTAPLPEYEEKEK